MTTQTTAFALRTDDTAWIERNQRLVRDVRDDELVNQPLGIRKAEQLAIGLDLVTFPAQAVGPELERCGRSDPPDDGVDDRRRAQDGGSPGSCTPPSRAASDERCRDDAFVNWRPA